MTAQARRLPISLDPVMAKANWGSSRRHVAVAAVGLLVAAAALTFALLFPGRPSASHSSAHRVLRAQGLANIRVPVDSMEAHWRYWISNYHYGSRARRSRLPLYQRDVRKHAAASGAQVVRLRLWPTTRPPTVDVVVATAIRPAVYLRHDLGELYKGINGHFMYVEVVGRHGRKIYESAIRNNGGVAYVKPGLVNCVPISLAPPPTPCPVP